MGKRPPKGTKALTGGGEAEGFRPIRARDPADVSRPGVVGHNPTVQERAHGDASILLHDVARAILACELGKHHTKLVAFGAGGVLCI
jgi:hypothetical protein